jgi:CheY-like chemotaxis protein
MRILIVEDNPINAKLLEQNLVKNGYETIRAENGKQALECLDVRPDIELVISDIMMPEMDGLELLCKLKAQPAHRDLPIIMCTSLSDMETVRKAARGGCRHYIVKPIDSIQLLQKVNEVLANQKPVLKDPVEIMAELSLSEAGYKQITAAFAAIIDETIGALEKRSRPDAAAGKALGLHNLYERASLLGAEKAVSILDRIADPGCGAGTHARNIEYGRLISELKQLQQALRP